MVKLIEETLGSTKDNAADQGAISAASGQASAVSSAVTTVWSWIIDRDDVSVGSDKKYNGTPLSELLALSASQQDTSLNGVVAAPAAKGNSANDSTASVNSNKDDTLKVRLAEETEWELLTGHGIDRKRVPNLEWVLIRGIASTKSEGILQGDLGRLVGQDKRSVPKRTDTLVAKGYVVKRTALIRGTKTSKLWLKSFAPSTLKSDDNKTDPSAEMILSRQILVENLDVVPWHSRWTGKVVDYPALLTTIMALCKEWGVLRIVDLKAKLGILRMKWQMKVVAKICRFLNARGMVEYVAAQLHERVYKDCLRFIRDLTARDWSVFLATGKRMTRWAREGGQDGNDDDLDGEQQTNPACSTTVIARTSPWTPDCPLSTAIGKLLHTFRQSGLTNPELCCLTIGPSFSRYIFSFTLSMSIPNIQPDHLRHLQVVGQQFRDGKISAYRYFLPRADEPEHVSEQEQAFPYGFWAPCNRPQHGNKALTLSELCGLGVSLRRKRGRPKKLTSKQQEESESREGTVTDLVQQVELVAVEPPPPPRKRGRPRKVEILPEEVEEAESSTAANQSAEHAEGTTESIQVQHAEEQANGDVQTENVNGSATAAPDAPAPATDETGEAAGARLTQDDKDARRETPLEDEPHASSPRGGSRGRGRGRGRPPRPTGRGRPAGSKARASAAPSRSWTCEKCGKSWKNDNGLQYHIEKSLTTCNPSFNPDDVKLLVRGKRRKAAAPDESVNGENDEDAEEEEDQPPRSGSEVAIVRISKISNPLEISSRRTSVAIKAEEPDLQAPQHRSAALLLEESAPQRQVPAKLGRPPKASSSVVPTRDQYGWEVVENVAAEQSSAKPHDPTHSPVPKTEDGRMTSVRIRREKLSEKLQTVLDEILKEHKGIVAGETSLWNLLRSKWPKFYGEEPAPSTKELQNAFKVLLKKKVAVEHWHGFRRATGAFARCQIVAWPSIDAFAPETMRLVNKIKEYFPQPLYSEDGEALPILDNYGATPNRRILATDVAVLNAPVYASQPAKKRGRRYSDSNMPSPKRRRLPKRLYRLLDLGGRPPARKRRARALWGVEETPDVAAYEILTSTSTANLMAALQISVTGAKLDAESEDPLLFAAEAEVESTIKVRQLQQMSTRKDAYFLEDLAATLQFRGWAPEMDWFTSLLVPDDPEDDEVEDNFSPKAWFDARVKDCLRLETRHADALTSFDYELQPKVPIFISLCGGTDQALPPTASIEWERLDENLEKVEDGHSSSSEDEPDDEEAEIRFIDPQLEEGESEPIVLHEPEVKEMKRAKLAIRSFTSFPDGTAQIEPTNSFIDKDELLAAFIAVRTLVGGGEKAVDWGLLLHIFPGVGLPRLRREWAALRKERGPYIAKLIRAFQEQIIEAFSNDELPLPDYDNLLDYDWDSAIRWTMDLQLEKTFRMPSSSNELERKYAFFDSDDVVEDWREKYFHQQTSVFARFESASLDAGSVGIGSSSKSKAATSDLNIAKSWVRSLCSTSDDKYSPPQIKMKLSTLGNGDMQSSNLLLKQAIDDLTKDKVICRAKLSASQARPYRLNESYTTLLSKIAQRQKFKDACAFKKRLDATFERHGFMTVPYNLDDGAMMVLTNLAATGRIKIRNVDVPHIPFGFEPGNYESRKHPKSFYHFGLETEPTSLYQSNDEISPLVTAKDRQPPTLGAGGELPQWIDFFGQPDVEKWCDIMGAACFIIATRGSMTVDGICSAMSPILQPFEAQLIMQWGRETGFLMAGDDEDSTEAGEWWWLSVPWQKQQV